MFTITKNGLNAITKELEVISNNIANSRTTAFKKSRTEFVDIYSKSLSDNPKSKKGLGALMQGSRKIMKQGSPIMTGNALDLSISGGGFFVLSPTDTSAARFTRDGSFTLNATGDVLTMEGFRVAGYLGEDPSLATEALPINIPLTQISKEGRSINLSALKVNSSGIIEATYGLNETKVIGQIALAKFNNETALRSNGSNTYEATSVSGTQILGEAMKGSFGQIISGALESSNTDITNEMVALLKTQQAFGGNARIMQSTLDVIKRLMG